MTGHHLAQKFVKYWQFWDPCPAPSMAKAPSKWLKLLH